MAAMMDRKVSITDLALLAVTRAALGVGIGFLLAGRLTGDQRKAAGIALAVVGGLTTIPLVVGINKRSDTELRPAA
jgi:hypothetical protein